MLKLSDSSSFVVLEKHKIEENKRLHHESLHSTDKSEKSPSCLQAVTENIVDLYKKCNGKISILDSRPQRILTNPSIPGSIPHDNADGNLIVKVNDKIESPKGITYSVVDILGVGTFGQVFRCYKDQSRESVAIKVIKNIPAYYNQGLLEIKVVNTLNKSYDPNNQRHIVRLLDSFEYRSHVCLVFELLHSSLLDVLTQNQYRGLPLTIIQRIARQLLIALVTLQDANIIHCDIKPENILLLPRDSHRSDSRKSNTTQPDRNHPITSALTSSIESSQTSDDMTSTPVKASEDGSSQVARETPSLGSSPAVNANISSDIKLIDFGSACLEDQTMFSYIQSRFYRAPEVLLGVPYNGAIDVWSFACVCVELYLGLPLFPGVSQHNQLSRIVEMFGQPPDSLIGIGKNSSKYFVRIASSLDTSTHGHPSTNGSSISGTTTNSAYSGSETSSSQYRIKTAEEYAKDTKTEVPVLKKYLRYSQLDDVIMKCSLPGKSRTWTSEQKQEEYQRRQNFLDFLHGMFRLHPFDRWTAKQAAGHPFITNASYNSPYHPTPDVKTNERKLSYIVQSQNDISNKPKPAVRLSTNSGSSIPRPIQQPPQLLIPSSIMTSQQQAPSLLSPSSSSSQQHEFLPLNRRRLSDPTNSSYLQANLQYASSLSVSTLTNQHGNMQAIGSNQKMLPTSLFSSTQEQSRPMLKRGQSVLPRRDDMNEQEVSSPSSAATVKRQNSSGSMERQPDTMHKWQSSTSNQDYLTPHQHHNYHHNQHQHPSQSNVAFSQPISSHSQWQHPQHLHQNQHNMTSHHHQNPATFDYIAASYHPHTDPALRYGREDLPATMSLQNQPYANSMMSSSYMPSMSYNMSGTSGVEGRNPAMMTDFGQALLRPDMDEDRRFQSMNSPYYHKQPYVAGSMRNSSTYNSIGNHQYTPTHTSHNQQYLNNMGMMNQPAYSYGGYDSNHQTNNFQSSPHHMTSSSVISNAATTTNHSHHLSPTTYNHYNPSSFNHANMSSTSMLSPMMSQSYSDHASTMASDQKISASYQQAAHQASYHDNPLHSGMGFEHMTPDCRSASHDEDADDQNLINEAQIVADWEPFFQMDDIANQGHTATSDYHKDINQYL